MEYGKLMPLTAVAAFAAAVVCGCKTNKQRLDDYGRALERGDYEAALSEVSGQAEKGGIDELLWRLHAGGSQYLLQNQSDAIAQFDLAEDLFAKIDANGVFGASTDTSFAMLTNDRGFPFAGTGGDRVFTCLYKAIDYVASGNSAAARTELNRAAQHQDNWLDDRRKEIEAAQEKLKEDSDAYVKSKGAESKGDETDKAQSSADKALADQSFGAMVREKCGFDPAKDGNLEAMSRKDWLNLYAEHVTGVFRWLAGEDDARVYLKEVAELKPGNAMVRRDFEEAQSGARPKDQVWVFVEDGLSPVREEWRIDLPLALIPYANRFVLYAGMALPYLVYRSQACDDYRLSGSGSVALEELEDVDRLGKAEFDVYFRGALTREIVRTVVKASVQVGLGVAAETTNTRDAKLAFRLAQVAAAGYAACVTQADLRSWTGLPKKVYAARVDRPADGKLSLTASGTPVAQIELPAGNSMVFVRKPSAIAPAVVKVATF